MLITFSGLDGAGKTTLITWLRGELERQRRRVVVLHLNDDIGVYAWLRAVRDRLRGGAPPPAPPRMEPLPTRLGRLRDAILWSRWLRALLYPVDLVAFLIVRLYVETVRRRVLVMDRYFYDRLVDLSGRRGWGWLRLLARVTPAPDLPVLLEISPEAAFARKGEYTVPYLQRRHAAYHRVFPWVPGALTVSTAPPDNTRQVLAHAVQERLGLAGDPEDAAPALAVLRLLLDDPRIDPDDLDWIAVGAAAERGGVVVRLADRLTRRGDGLPPRLGAAAVQARSRAERMLLLADQLGAACRRHGIAHAFLKVAERFPDTGRDLDLLIAPTTPEVDRLVLGDLPCAPRPRGLRDRLTGAATYAMADDLVVDIHHGRLGQFGEHARYAQTVLARARLVSVHDGPLACMAPRPEDQLLLQVLHQVYSRPAFRLADVLWTLAALREGKVNWNLLTAAAVAMDLLPAVTGYFEYVNRVHRQIFAPTTTVPEPAALRFPRPRFARRWYARQVLAALAGRNWEGAARLALLPAVALAAGVRGFRSGALQPQLLRR